MMDKILTPRDITGMVDCLGLMLDNLREPKDSGEWFVMIYPAW